MHQDLVSELAREFQDELLTSGVDANILGRMIERSINRAVENGSHMTIGDVWRLVGGSSNLTPDAETVVAALEAAKPADSGNQVCVNFTAIEQAVLRVHASNFSSGKESAEDCRARVARYVASEFASLETAAAATVQEQAQVTPVMGTSIDLDSDRQVWAGKRGTTTYVCITNTKETRVTRFALSSEATKALLAVLMEAEFPGIDRDLTESMELDPTNTSDPAIAKAYMRDWEKSVRAIEFWSKDVPEIQGLCPENALYTLAGMYLTLRDSMRDQKALGWLYTGPTSGLRAFSQELPDPSSAGDFRPVYGVPLEIAYVAASAARWLTARDLLSAPADDSQRILFTEIVADLPTTPESIDLAVDTIIAGQTATKEQWIRRYAAHCVTNGRTASQAETLAESTYNPEHWRGVTPEAAAEQDLRQLRTDGAL